MLTLSQQKCDFRLQMQHWAFVGMKTEAGCAVLIISKKIPWQEITLNALPLRSVTIACSLWLRLHCFQPVRYLGCCLGVIRLPYIASVTGGPSLHYATAVAAMILTDSERTWYAWCRNQISIEIKNSSPIAHQKLCHQLHLRAWDSRPDLLHLTLISRQTTSVFGSLSFSRNSLPPPLQANHCGSLFREF